MLTDADQCLPPFGGSDHAAISLGFPSCPYGQNSCCGRPTKSSKYMWHQANYDSLREYLSAIDWPTVVYNNSSAEQLWTLSLVYLRMLSNCLHLRQCTVISSAKLNYVTLVLTGNVLPPNAIFGQKLMKRPYDTVLREKYRNCVYRRRQLLVISQTRIEENLISADNVGAFYRCANRRIVITVVHILPIMCS